MLGSLESIPGDLEHKVEEDPGHPGWTHKLTHPFTCNRQFQDANHLTVHVSELRVETGAPREMHQKP